MTFQEILDRYGVEHSVNPSRPGWVQFDCPWCGRRETPYMGWRSGTGVCYCWKCRAHSVFEVVREISNLPTREVKRLIEGIGDDIAPVDEQDVRGRLVLPSPFDDPFPARHRRYLEEERGLSFDFCINTIQIKALSAFARVKTPDGRKIRLDWRIFIPYILGGKIVSWTTRALKASDPMRYFGAPANCEAINRKDLLFMEDLANYSVCVVEGEFDAIKVGAGCVATGGIAYKPAQVRRIARFPIRGVWFDNEAGAQERAAELVAELKLFPGETYLIQGDSKDPGCASQREIKHVRNFLKL